MSIKQCVEPESETNEEESEVRSKFGSERADALSQTDDAQEESMQPSACAEV